MPPMSLAFATCNSEQKLKADSGYKDPTAAAF
jgi:hypothetical protein